MAGRYRTSRESNRSRFYLLLSVVFVVIMFKWGIPFLMDVIAGKGEISQVEDKDVIPPQTPLLSALPEATNSSSMVVEGYTETGASLEYLINDTISQIGKALEDGSFSTPVRLQAGSNRVYVRAIDEAGNASTSEVEIVVFDDKPVELIIISPKDGSEFFGKNSQIIEITGEVNKKDSQIVINNSFVLVDSLGKFIHRFQLSDRNNEINVIASDMAGNTDSKTIKILYTP